MVRPFDSGGDCSYISDTQWGYIVIVQGGSVEQQTIRVLVMGNSEGEICRHG